MVQDISFHHHRAVLATMDAVESDDEALLYPEPRACGSGEMIPNGVLDLLGGAAIRNARCT